MDGKANGPRPANQGATKRSDNSIPRDNEDNQEILLLEDVAREQRHLHVPDIKPCAAAYLQGSANPEVGMRSELAKILALEVRRAGVDQEDAQVRLGEWWQSIPGEIRNAPDKRGRGFSLKDVESWVRSVYRIPAAEFEGGAGCYNPIWERTCMGEDVCPFYAKIKTHTRGQTRAGGLWLFLKEWANAPSFEGGFLLGHKEVRLYTRIIAIEDERGYAPGNPIIMSLAQLGKETGFTEKRSLVRAIRNLVMAGLLTGYSPGQRRQKGQPAGVATQFKRVIPVPRPPKVKGAK